ncbi:hypothetical protein ACFOOL_12940 [Devosia honganensis]|uniref:Uncharacterized protein n=1 Tax=Devosia honganensis TaxID=1610527 RepID=A0ABV7X2X1_9HYPH
MAKQFWTQERKQIVDLIDVTRTYGLDDDAVANLEAGRPAFWSTCGNSNDFDGLLFAAINRYASIEAGQEEYAGIFARRGMDPTDEIHLDYLIPLNTAAVTMLMLAYQSVGTWRTPEELAKRATSRGWPSFPARGRLAPVEAPALVAAE